ncbi:major capsid protein [Chicken microvirus mg7_20]|nr:major capsid protein [Chicken microvirus mg7_20]
MKKRAKFNLSNFHNCTFKMGFAYPVNLIEALPGDIFQLNSSVFLRLAPMVSPVMHPVHMSMYHFFVPSRILGPFLDFDFEDFITGGPNGTDTQTIPQITLTASNSPVGGLADAFGVPVQMLTNTQNSISVNALPFAAYYMIWNEYFRDQDLSTEFDLSTLSGSPDSLPLLRPAWAKDYFTTARPWPQKGPDVTIPIAGDPSMTVGYKPSGTGVTVKNPLTGQPINAADSGYPMQMGNWTWDAGSSGGSASPEEIVGYPLGMPTPTFSPDKQGLQLWQSPSSQLMYAFVEPKSSGPTGGTEIGGTAGAAAFDFDVSGSLKITGSNVGYLSVDHVRQGFALQRMQEHRATFGSRYEDYLRFLGIRPQDARLQLPEYLGGFSAPIQFSEVLQTSAGENGGVGDLYGHGIGAGRGRRVRCFIPENGYIMSLLVVRPIPVYAQGLERLWSKKTRTDFWQKEFEHIGQQEVLNSEVYANGTTDDAVTFGYQNRYDEYRRGVNIITGEFRTTQDYWTMARIFANRPALNQDFITCMPTDRIFQVGEQNSDQVYCMIKNSVVARRIISKNGNPI